MHIFKNSNFDFLRWRWAAIVLSALIIGAGIVTMVTRGIPLGVEFSGGTNMIVRFAAPVSEDSLRAALQSIPSEVQQFGEAGGNQMLIRLPQTQAVEQGASLSADIGRAQELLRASGLPPFTVEGTEIVGPTVGAELRRKAIYATLASMFGITAWIAVRFRLSFAAGSIVATFHDVLMTLSFLALFRFEMSLNVIAAMLTMVGYSMNDMIVIFDRVRENARVQRRETIEKMINTSLNQTLARTVITSGTSFAAVLALYLFGGEVLRGFAFTMLVGTLATTYSGWFIAPALAIMLSRKPTAGHRPASHGEAAAPQSAGKSKSARKVRAS